MRWVIFLGILAISNPTLAQMKAIDLEKHCRAVDRIVEGREILVSPVSTNGTDWGDCVRE